MFGTVRDESTRVLAADPEPSADFLWELTVEAAAQAREAESAGLPAGFDSWLPSPFLAAVVSALSPRELSGFDQIVLLQAEQRLVAHFQALAYETMASVHEVMTELEGGDAEFGFRMASAEIRAALHQTARAANAEVRFALDLDDTY